MTKHGRSWLVAGAVVAFVALALITALHRYQAEIPSEPVLTPTRPAPPALPGTGGASVNGPAAASRPSGAAVTPKDVLANGETQRAEPVQDPQVRRLSELLDGEDNAATLAQAQEMIVSPDATVRAAALDALRWVGDKEAALALAGMVNDPNPDLAEQAADGLRHVLKSLDEPTLSATILEQAILKAPPGDGVAAMFLTISGLPESASVPVLLNLLETKVPHVSALASEYLAFVTGSDEITDRSQAEAWLREQLRNEAEAEKN